MPKIAFHHFEQRVRDLWSRYQPTESELRAVSDFDRLLSWRTIAEIDAVLTQCRKNYPDDVRPRWTEIKASLQRGKVRHCRYEYERTTPSPEGAKELAQLQAERKRLNDWWSSLNDEEQGNVKMQAWKAMPITTHRLLVNYKGSPIDNGLWRPFLWAVMIGGAEPGVSPELVIGEA